MSLKAAPKTQRSIVPADISAESRSLVQETAKAIYRALGCRGLSRVDMFLKEDGTVVLNEVNTLPGMTSYSRYPRMMAAAGLPLAEVIDRLVSLALAGKADEQLTSSSSTSSYPEYAGMPSTPPGTTSPASRWTDTWPTASSARGLCARPWTRAREKAASLGFGLLLWDGYRPQRAVDCFLRWSKQPEDGRTKPRHYPNIDRAEMFEKGYVAAKSGHSRGGTVDLTLYHLATGELAPMGGGHDLMDPVSHHGAKGITPAEARNRQHLRSIMQDCGFGSYDCEWWHYTLERRTLPRHLFRFSHHIVEPGRKTRGRSHDGTARRCRRRRIRPGTSSPR